MRAVIIQERDRIASRKVISIGVGSIVIFILGVLGAWRILEVRKHALAPLGPAPTPPEIGQIKIGIVQQNLYSEPQWPDAVREQKQQLESYGWVDREHGIAHVPIERAMEIMAAQAQRKSKPEGQR
jgi:hypothetical protein